MLVPRMYAMADTLANRSLARFFDDLVRCETRLYNAVGESLRARHDMVASQFEFLRYLRDHPGSRVVDIATHFAAGIGAISKGVDRLEARGWASRAANPADRRSLLISLTPGGAELLAEAERTFRDQLRALIGATLSAEQVDAGVAILSALRGALEREQIGLPVG
jgi:MarR family multiple antibiotic resistance transcriptional regulator